MNDRTEVKHGLTRDLAAERSRREILQIATNEFALHGLAGARVQAIAEQMRTSKGMIYYYFGNKEGLYLAVLENVYASIREAEDNAHLDPSMPADTMLQAYIELTFDYHDHFPVFSRIISMENIHNARFLKRSAKIKLENLPVLATLQRIIDRGISSKIFRPDVSATELHYMISALCVYRVSNRSTFGAIFDVDFEDPDVRCQQRRLAVDAILGMLRRDRSGG